MEIKKEREYKTIDVARMFFCVCIVFLHSGAYHLVPWGEWYVLHGILRLAVPFFFVVSGFFWGMNIRKKQDLKRCLIRYEKRLLYPYVVFSIINIFLTVVEQLLNGERLWKVLLRVIRSVIFYPYGALWYVWACMVGAVLLYCFLKKDKFRLGLIIGVILYVIALLMNSYYFLIDGTVAGKMADIYLKITTSARNGIFVGFIFMGLGVAIAYKLDWLMKKRQIIFCAVGAALAWICLFCETWMIQGKKTADDHSLFLSFLILIPALVVLMLRFELKIRSEWVILCRHLSAGVYFMHRASLTAITVMGILFHFEINRLLAFIFVLVFNISICLWSYHSDRQQISMLLR